MPPAARQQPPEQRVDIRPLGREVQPVSGRSMPQPPALLAGAMIGFASGLTGIGGGVFLSPILLLGGWSDARRAAPLSAAFIFVNSIAGLLGNGQSLAALPADGHGDRRALEEERDVLARRIAAVPFIDTFDLRYNNRILESFSAFASPSGIRAEAESFLAAHRDQSPLVTPVDPAYSLVFVRNANPKGPMSGFGYDYFVDKLGAENSSRVRLLHFAGSRGSGADYAYEVLNSVDGERSAGLIAEAVSAVYGPVPIEMVVEYLHALESIGVIREKK